MSKSIFEMIIEGSIPSLKVYEDENFIAILDINPKQKGHTLLIPKVKNESIINDSEFVLENILKIAKVLSNKLLNNLNASGIKLTMNNGSSAGQEVFHTHLHLIPYYDEKVDPINNEEVLKEILKNG